MCQSLRIKKEQFKMTSNLSTQGIKNLFDNGDINGAWKLHKKLVYEYVSNQPYYLSKCKKVEILYPGETFISNLDLLYKNEFSRSLFEDWIQNYWDIHDRYNYSASSALLVNEKNDLEHDTIVDHVIECWENEDYDHNFSYLRSQFEARGEEISSPGNSVVRNILFFIKTTVQNLLIDSFFT